MKYAGADWVKRSMKVDNMSKVGEAAADLLGDVFLGIYHLDGHQLRKVDWSDDHAISIVIGWNDFSTFDGDILTRIVVLAHDRMMRVEVNPHTFHHLRLLITKRRSRTGSTYERCPTLEDHIKLLREHYS